jgi:hypothetical protein
MRASEESTGEHLFFITVSSLSNHPIVKLLFVSAGKRKYGMPSYATAFVGKKNMIAWTILEECSIIMCRPNLVNGGTHSPFQILPMGQDEVVGPPVVPTNGKPIRDGSGWAGASFHPVLQWLIIHNNDT